MNVDIVIIGGGPSGITAATTLTRRGYSCIIIDKSIFPRKKLCGGVLTQKALLKVQRLYKNIEFKEHELNYIETLEFWYKYKLIDRYGLKNGFNVIDRTEFDQKLMDYYLKIGGELLQGQTRYTINYDENTVILNDGTIIHYKVLIGADGINSCVRTYVDEKKLPQVFCFEKFVPINKLHPGKTISIHFGLMLGGYAWKIPSNKALGIGMGEIKFKGAKTTYQKFIDFCVKSYSEGRNGIKGAAVSCGFYVKKPVKNNVLLVGDAAGLIDGITGEGIYFALYSGEIAAYTVDLYLKKGVTLNRYKQNMRRIHKVIDEHNIYNKLFYFPITQCLILAYIKANHGFAQMLFDDVISTYSISYARAFMKWQKYLLCRCFRKRQS